MVPGTQPAWFRGGAGASDAAFERFVDGPGRRSTSGRTGARSSRPTRWARPGWARRRVTTPATRRARPPQRPVGRSVVGGLYVADTSLFPTGLGVNPMLTVMALARRVARTVLAEG